jgi:hypothetical protein
MKKVINAIKKFLLKIKKKIEDKQIIKIEILKDQIKFFRNRVCDLEKENHDLCIEVSNLKSELRKLKLKERKIEK